MGCNQRDRRFRRSGCGEDHSQKRRGQQEGESGSEAELQNDRCRMAYLRGLMGVKCGEGCFSMIKTPNDAGSYENGKPRQRERRRSLRLVLRRLARPEPGWLVNDIGFGGSERLRIDLHRGLMALLVGEDVHVVAQPVGDEHQAGGRVCGDAERVDAYRNGRDHGVRAAIQQAYGIRAGVGEEDVTGALFTVTPPPDPRPRHRWA